MAELNSGTDRDTDEARLEAVGGTGGVLQEMGARQSGQLGVGGLKKPFVAHVRGKVAPRSVTCPAEEHL